MSYERLRPAALEWDAIQRARIGLNNMLRGFERHKRPVPPWLDSADGGMLQMLESQERAALRAVVRAASEGDAWLMQVSIGNAGRTGWAGRSAEFGKESNSAGGSSKPSVPKPPCPMAGSARDSRLKTLHV